SPDWKRGFLAGIFDAEGSRSESLRICNKDLEILNRTEEAMRNLGFDVTLEKANACGARNVRLRGGLRQQMRFLQHINPVISRKRSIEGIAIKSDAKFKVVEIEP